MRRIRGARDKVAARNRADQQLGRDGLGSPGALRESGGGRSKSPDVSGYGMQAAIRELVDGTGAQESHHRQGSVSPARGPPGRPDCLAHPYGTGSSRVVARSATSTIGFQGEQLDDHVEQGPERWPYASIIEFEMPRVKLFVACLGFSTL